MSGECKHNMGCTEAELPNSHCRYGEEVHAGKHSNSVNRWITDHSVVKIEMSREIIIFNMLDFFFKVSKRKKNSEPIK